MRKKYSARGEDLRERERPRGRGRRGLRLRRLGCIIGELREGGLRGLEFSGGDEGVGRRIRRARKGPAVDVRGAHRLEALVRRRGMDARREFLRGPLDAGRLRRHGRGSEGLVQHLRRIPLLVDHDYGERADWKSAVGRATQVASELNELIRGLLPKLLFYFALLRLAT